MAVTITSSLAMARGDCTCIHGAELKTWICISVAGVTSRAVCSAVVLKPSCTTWKSSYMWEWQCRSWQDFVVYFVAVISNYINVSVSGVFVRGVIDLLSSIVFCTGWRACQTLICFSPMGNLITVKGWENF
jgi:hypothetical protein